MRKAQTDDSKEATLDLHFRSLMILLLGVYLLWINTNISPVDSCNMIRKKYIQESVIRGCKVSTTEDVIPKGNVRDKNCILYVSFFDIVTKWSYQIKYAHCRYPENCQVVW